MTKSLSFTPEQRLASLLRRPGGVSIEEAVARANHRVEAVRNHCVSALDEKIDAMGAVALDGASPAQIYALSSEIFSLAATFELEELAQAASSLCDLLAKAQAQPDMAQSGRAFVESVGVHVDALRTLRRPELGGDAAARQAVVDGLRKVALKHKGDSES